MDKPIDEVWMFKGTEGDWHTFIDENHRLNTIDDGRWEVRKFTALTAAQQQGQAVGWVSRHDAMFSDAGNWRYTNPILCSSQESPDMIPLYTAPPPSVPVGVEAEPEYRPQTGEPPKWFEEWFIAKLDTGARVVLRRLPEEYPYDYTTADNTYYKASRLRWWMQFPDSQFKPLEAAVAPQPESPDGKVVGVEAVVLEAVTAWEECKSPLAAQEAMFKIANDLRANEAERALTAAQQQGQAVGCGGCGNADPEKVCTGCLHPFAAPQPMQQGSGEVCDCGATCRDDGQGRCRYAAPPSAPVGVVVASEPLEYWLYTATDVQLRELFDSHPAVAERLRAALAAAPSAKEVGNA